MRESSNFIFESVERLDYKLQKIKLKRGGSYINSPKWIRDKKATTNQKNEDDNDCFQYALNVALNYQNIENHSERISNIKLFINKYNWKNIFAHQNGEEESENSKNIMAIALNIALNYQNIENHSERISNIKLFINKYNWKNIFAHQSGEEESENSKNIMAIDWKKFEQNNETIAFNIL